MNQPQLRTLAVDIGGSGIKVMVLDVEGNPLSDRQRLKTPHPATPPQVIDTILTLVKEQEYDRVSVGFPGVVQSGVIKTAVNLHDYFGNRIWFGFICGGKTSSQPRNGTSSVSQARNL